MISTIWRDKEIAPEYLFIHNDEMYFTDGLCQLFKVFPNGITKTIAGIKNEAGFNGDDMLATECKLNCPMSIFIDDDSQIIIADTDNDCIRRIDRKGVMRTIVGTGKPGYSGDVPFNFQQYPHIGPWKKQLIKFLHAFHDLIVKCEEKD